MSITASILEDKVIIDYHNRKPYGQPDDEGRFVVMFDTIPRLNPPPSDYTERSGSYTYTREEVYIPKLKKKIVFFTEALGCCGGPPDEELKGPFLLEE